MDNTTATATALAAERNLQIDRAVVQAHVMRPANVEKVTSSRGFDEGNPIREFKMPPELHAKKKPVFHFDVTGFGNALHAAMKDSVAGYVMQLRQGGNTIYTLEWQWAKTPEDGGEGWNPGVRMHIASCSKLITAIAMTKVLNDKKISYDTPIAQYLPTYWSKGPNVDKITFRKLMTHTSGFRSDGSQDYGYMKNMVAAGVNAADMNKGSYQNMNFGLCRILIPIVHGNLAPGWSYFPASIFDFINDLAWDMTTIQDYAAYVQHYVFAPSGVPTNGPTFSRPDADALAYDFPVSDEGWDSGDLKTASGGAGWHMSVDDLLKVMGTFRRKGAIMSTSQAQTTIDSGFGIDVITSTPVGNVYNKNGLWHNGAQTEQSLAYFLPQDMEMVVLANSPIGATSKFFRDYVTNIYLANIKAS